MSDGKSNKGSSVLAFLFMPQLRFSFQHFSNIIPMFMRTIAVMFEQGGLIPPDHPATFYGRPGVPRYGFMRLMSEAWIKLRTTPSTPPQWAMFASVVMMVVMILGGTGEIILKAGFGFGSQAQAQLFSLTPGTTPDTGVKYGGTTDANVANMTAGMQATACTPVAPATSCLPSYTEGTAISFGFNTDQAATVPMFDKGVLNGKTATAANAGHMDYGIMILDKILREGMQGVGGRLQIGMQSMFATFNSGVLVVAGLMLFWIILSVVVDTAKTGVLGGQRHNIVWAPIRIVFGLTLIIPLGSNCAPPTLAAQPGVACGFTAGQFMVVKLAEWGSNLGSNLWISYVKNVTTWETLVPTAGPTSATAYVQAYTNMWVCRVAYNALQWQATVGKPEAGVVGSMTDGGTPPTLTPHVAAMIPQGVEVDFVPLQNTKQGFWSYAFTDGGTGPNICGTVQLPDDDILGGNADPTLVGVMSAHSGPGPVSSATQKALGGLKAQIDDAYLMLFAAYDPGYDPTQSKGFDFSVPGTMKAGQGSYDANKGNSPPRVGVPGSWPLTNPLDGAYDVPTKDQSGILGPLARAWACDFVAQQVVDAENGSALSRATYFAQCGNNCNGGTPNSAAAPVCPSRNDTAGSAGDGDSTGTTDFGSSPGAGPCGGTLNHLGGHPPIGSEGMDPCMREMIGIFGHIVGDTITTASSGLRTALGQDMYDDALIHGWAGMGTWFQKIQSADVTLLAVITPQVTITEPSLYSTSAGSKDQKGSDFQEAMVEIQAAYQRWWPYRYVDTPAAKIPLNAGPAAADKITRPDPTKPEVDMSAIAEKIAGKTNPDSFKNDLAGLIKSKFIIGFANDIAYPNDPDLYPFSQMVVLGRKLAMIGIGISATLQIFPTLVGKAMAGANASTAVANTVITLSTGQIFQLLGTIANMFTISGMMMGWWLPLLPWIRVSFAVLGWMASVFEAVALTPIAALSFLATEGDGFAGGGKSREAIATWLGLLFRPALIVVGFVASIMLFNTFVAYFFDMYQREAGMAGSGATNDMESVTDCLAATVVFVMTIFTVANACFKMIDIIPNAFHGYVGGHGANDLTHGHSEVGAVFRGQFLGTMANRAFGAPDSALAAQQMQQAWGGGITGNSAGVVNAAQMAGAGFHSDRRLKTAIVPMGQENGFNVYAFSYIGDTKRYIGVMADEVLQTRPDAIGTLNGYHTVNYGKIGVEFREIT